MLTPGQIAKTLDVSSATVRRWSARFARHLSPHTPGKKRSYTVDDLATLTRVRDMSANGTPLDQINQALMVSDEPATNALITVADFAQALQFANDHLASMQNKLDQTNDRLACVAIVQTLVQKTSLVIVLAVTGSITAC